MDPALGFDFYATDLVLQAQEAGLASAVVDAYCEHWSDTPSSGPMPRELFERVKANGHAFELKWAHRLPVSTPCFEITRPGDFETGSAHGQAVRPFQLESMSVCLDTLEKLAWHRSA